MRDEVIIYDKNSNTGVRDAKYYSGEDTNRISVQYHFSPRLSNLTQVSGIEGHFARRFKYFWVDAFASTMNTIFEEVSENKTGKSQATGAKPDDLGESFLTLGLGLTYRFKFFMHFKEFDRLFQTVSAFGTYHRVY